MPDHGEPAHSLLQYGLATFLALLMFLVFPFVLGFAVADLTGSALAGLVVFGLVIIAFFGLLFWGRKSGQPAGAR